MFSSFMLNLKEEARLAEHFITMKQIERGHRLNNFQKEVKQRVKEKEVDKQRKLGKLVRKIVSATLLMVKDTNI